MCERFISLIVLLGVMEFTYAQPMNDPTRPPDHWAPVAPSASPQALPRISAIQIGRWASHAVINGAPLKVGEVHAGIEVVDIQPGRVKLKMNEQLLEVPLLARVKKVMSKVR